MEKLNFVKFDHILLSYTSIETLLYNCFVIGEGNVMMGTAIHFNRKLKYGVVFLFVLVLVCLYTINSRNSSGGYIKFEDQPIRKVREKLRISSKDVPVIIVDEHQEGKLPCFKLSYYLLTYTFIFSFHKFQYILLKFIACSKYLKHA